MNKNVSTAQFFPQNTHSDPCTQNSKSNVNIYTLVLVFMVNYTLEDKGLFFQYGIIAIIRFLLCFYPEIARQVQNQRRKIISSDFVFLK